MLKLVFIMKGKPSLPAVYGSMTQHEQEQVVERQLGSSDFTM
jgi:hypothetical protein